MNVACVRHSRDSYGGDKGSTRKAQLLVISRCSFGHLPKISFNKTIFVPLEPAPRFALCQRLKGVDLPIMPAAKDIITYLPWISFLTLHAAVTKVLRMSRLFLFSETGLGI